jgi:anti-sigma regulatory factor (Ser/Thr protein kinase)
MIGLNNRETRGRVGVRPREPHGKCLHEAVGQGPAQRHRPSFSHEALLYSGEDQFLEGTVRPILRAVGLGQPVLIAVTRPRTAQVREALADLAAHVRFAEIEELGRNPGRIIAAWHEFADQSARSGEGCLGIGEPIWAGRSSSEIDECERHEWLLNLAFAGGRPWRLICPYDVDRLEESVIERARHRHARSAADTADGPAEDWIGRAFSGELPEPPASVCELEFDRERLKTLRRVVATHAHDARLARVRAEQLVLCVSELASNSVLYAGGAGRARIWREPASLVCEIRDGGRMQAPLAGRIAPSPDQTTGRGLWLVNQFCDLVQIRSDETRTAVRVRMDLNGCA